MRRFFEKHKKLKKVLFRVALVLLFLASVLAQTTAFAWLSTTWRSGTFSIKTKNVTPPTAEVWHYVYEVDNNQALGWYSLKPKAIDEGMESFASIGVYNTTAKTFKPTYKFSLYFGTINNLAQEQDNLPVYVKFTFEPKINTSNKLNLQYSTDSDYVKIFQVDPAGADRTGIEIEDSDANENMISKLNQTGEFPFVRLNYIVSTTNYMLSVDDELPDGFEDLFDESNASLKEFIVSDPSTQSVEIDSLDGGKIYLYAKLSIRSDTLKKALDETYLKAVMPAYLLFRFNFGIDVQTQALVSNS